MRLIVFIFLALLSPLAGAQAARPACYPGVNGYPVDLPRLVHGSVGVHLFWLCSDSRGAPPREFGISVPVAQWSDAEAAKVISNLSRATAKVGTLNAAWDAGVRFSCTPAVRSESTARGALCRERHQHLVELLNSGWGK